MTLQEAYENFILSRRLADLSPKSVKDYQDFVYPFLAFAGASRDFSTVSQRDVNGYLASVLERPLSRSSRATYIRHFKIFLKWYLSSHRLRHNFATNYCIDQYETNGSIDIYRLMYLMGHEDVETTRRYLHFAYEILASRGCISHLDMLHYGKT